MVCRKEWRSQAANPARSFDFTARRGALEQLQRIQDDNAFIGLLQSADGDGLSGQDVRKTRALVAGVTRWRMQLDYIIGQICTRPMHKIHPTVRDVRPSSL